MEVLDGGCDRLLSELGPPPDAILRIPPPPLPHFIDPEYMKEIGLYVDHVDNDTDCHWCHWARRTDSSSISGTSGTGNSIDDRLVYDFTGFY